MKKREEGIEAQYRKPHRDSEEERIISELSSAGIGFSTFEPNARTSRQNDLTEYVGLSSGKLGVPDESIEAGFRTIGSQSEEEYDPEYVSPGILPETLRNFALNRGSVARLGENLLGTDVEGTQVTPELLAAMRSYLREAWKEQYYVGTRWGIKRATPTPHTEGMIQQWEWIIFQQKGWKGTGKMACTHRNRPVQEFFWTPEGWEHTVVVHPDLSNIQDTTELGRAEYIEYEEGSRLAQEVPEPVDSERFSLPEHNAMHLAWLQGENRRKFLTVRIHLDTRVRAWASDLRAEMEKLFRLSAKIKDIHFGQFSEKRKGVEKPVRTSWMVILKWKNHHGVVHEKKVQCGRPGLTFAQYWQLQFAITEQIVALMTVRHERVLTDLRARLKQAEIHGLVKLQEGLVLAIRRQQNSFEKRVESKWAYWQQDAKLAVLQSISEQEAAPQLEQWEKWVEKEWKKDREFRLLTGLPSYEEEQGE